MPDDSYIIELKDSIRQKLNNYTEILSAVRSNKISTSLVENILVECYGTQSPLKNLANIIVQPPNILIIEPWDPSILNELSHAIEISPLLIMPQKDQKFLRLVFPSLTAERREQLIKVINTEKEKIRIEIKQIREDIIRRVENDFQNKLISEDQKFYLKKEIQKVIDDANIKIDELTSKKEMDLQNE